MAVRSSIDRSSRLLEFLRTEEASGVFLLLAALVALVWANSAFKAAYHQLWSTVATLGIGSLSISLDLQGWVNEGLMTLFFLVVGLEIKREVTTGELRDPKTLALPIVAAIGGMVVPAGIYLVLNARNGTPGGWGIPVATDIAFALGILTLAASRAPISVRSFLLTLAIVDDIGAIILIAVFYSAGLSAGWIVTAAAIVAVLVLMRIFAVTSTIALVLLGIALWVSLLESGVHPTLTGVILGLLAPAVPVRRSGRAGTEVRELLDEAAKRPDREADAIWIAVGRRARTAVSPLGRAEASLHQWTSRLVVPMFALANAGVELSAAAFSDVVTSPLGLGVLLGLVVGKPLGIGAAIWAGTRTRIGQLPADVTPRMMVGVATLAGVGFTVALFISQLALDGEDVVTATLAVLIASLIAGTFGAAILRSGTKDDGSGRVILLRRGP
jgi:NhaA family Na+:H+ antiporter